MKPASFRVRLQWFAVWAVLMMVGSVFALRAAYGQSGTASRAPRAPWNHARR